MVSDYEWDSRDFYGPEECNRCAGTGVHWRTPQGRYVLYPGGPFCLSRLPWQIPAVPA